VEEQVYDEFVNCMAKGRKRDLAQSKKSVDQIKEEKRSKLVQKFSKVSISWLYSASYLY
jgi:hypothetical protein